MKVTINKPDFAISMIIIFFALIIYPLFLTNNQTISMKALKAKFMEIPKLLDTVQSKKDFTIIKKPLIKIINEVLNMMENYVKIIADKTPKEQVRFLSQMQKEYGNFFNPLQSKAVIKIIKKFNRIPGAQQFIEDLNKTMKKSNLARLKRMMPLIKKIRMPVHGIDPDSTIYTDLEKIKFNTIRILKIKTSSTTKELKGYQDELLGLMKEQMVLKIKLMQSALKMDGKKFLSFIIRIRFSDFPPDSLVFHKAKRKVIPDSEKQKISKLLNDVSSKHHTNTIKLQMRLTTLEEKIKKREKVEWKTIRRSQKILNKKTASP